MIRVVGWRAEDRRGGFGTVHPRHPQVHHDDVRSEVISECDRFRPVRAGPGHHEVGFVRQQLGEDQIRYS
jgi:hypothetical protein